MYERISDTEATLGEINSLVKENVRSKKNLLSQKNEGKPGLIEKFRYKTIGNKGRKRNQNKDINNIFNKIIE